MPNVTIYLKGWRDGRLYADAVNQPAHKLHDEAMAVHNRSFRSWEPGDVTYLAITYRAEGTDMEICDRAFETFNVGDDDLARTYRRLGHRSLSVGDVIAIDDRTYTVASLGFKKVDFQP